MSEGLTGPQALRAALTGTEPKELKQLSQELHISEKELPLLLEKLQRSLKHQALQLLVEAPHCLSCGFSFARSSRFKRPGRCPQCRSERLSRATYSLREG